MKTFTSRLLTASLALLSSTVLAQSSLSANSIWQDIENTVTCAGCETLLATLQALAHLGNDAFVAVIASVCILSGAEDADVCTGAVGLEGPIIAHDLREMTIPSKTSQLFCTTFFGLCDYPTITPYTVPFPKPKPATSRPAASGKTPMQVVQFSDIHVDLSYTTGANYNCTKNICCRPYTASDAPGKTPYPCGPNGNHQCDSPKTLEQSLYTAIETFAPNAAFSLFTGDVVEGAVWLVNQAEVTTDLQNAYTTMSSTLKMPVYAAVGNHDAAPVNSFPPQAINTTISSQYVYDTLSSSWKQWIGASAATQADNYGAYSYKLPSQNLRIISINTNLYYKENFWLYEQTIERDPDGQLAWFVSQLQGAEDAGQRVWVIGHMPLGSGDALHDGSFYLDQIVQRYSATIAAMFFGHTHKGEFQLSYSNYAAQTAANAVMTSYICPALTPTSGSPAFRVYSVDPVTYGILDYTEYSTSLETATYQTNGPIWSPYYSAKAAYGPSVGITAASAELTPAFWHNLTTVFQTNDTLFQQFNARKSRGYGVSACTGTCKTGTICQLRAAQAQYNCVAVTPGIDFKKAKRDEVQAGDGHEHGECGGSKAKEILMSLVGNQEELRNAIDRRMMMMM
ncbi:hypothetical protein LTR86_001209 [Recurvomyces mirabilis]|nr:hypothetical protein LTR86_001209 [Recurvomyces mirabilis]